MDKENYCDGCYELQEQFTALEAKLDAHIQLRTQRGPSGQMVPLCACGLLVTRNVIVEHPVAGQTRQLCCDYCTPRDVYGDGKREVHSQDYGLPADKIWATQVNELVHGRVAA